jgi:hypothetical protein
VPHQNSGFPQYPYIIQSNIAYKTKILNLNTCTMMHVTISKTYTYRGPITKLNRIRFI